MHAESVDEKSSGVDDEKGDKGESEYEDKFKNPDRCILRRY
jgi:hypothetical protein